jgi:hypothetical protein
MRINLKKAISVFLPLSLIDFIFIILYWPVYLKIHITMLGCQFLILSCIIFICLGLSTKNIKLSIEKHSQKK